MAKHNPKSLYAYTRKQLHLKAYDRDCISLLQNSASDLKTSNTDLSNILNKYFVRAFTHEDMNNIPEVDIYKQLQAVGKI